MTQQSQKTPERVLAIVRKCSAGQTLVKTYRLKESGEGETLFALEPSGRKVGPASAAQAISLGLLLPVGDGFFGESQTYTASAAQ